MGNFEETKSEIIARLTYENMRLTQERDKLLRLAASWQSSAENMDQSGCAGTVASWLRSCAKQVTAALTSPSAAPAAESE